jgi:hypothetical protein
MTREEFPEPPAIVPPRWAIVEIMGHRVVAGRLIWGEVPYDRGVAVDVPLPDGSFLQEFYGGGAIFSVRLVPEEVARREAAQSFHVRGAVRALLPAPAEPDREPWSAAREELYREIEARLTEDDFDELVAPDTEDGWMERIKAVVECIGELDRDDKRAYRRALRNLAAEAIGAIESHDREGDKEDPSALELMEMDREEDEGTF